MKFYPYEKGGGGGAEQVLAMLKGGHTKFCGSFYMVARNLNHTVGWQRKASTL